MAAALGMPGQAERNLADMEALAALESSASEPADAIHSRFDA